MVPFQAASRALRGSPSATISAGQVLVVPDSQYPAFLPLQHTQGSTAPDGHSLRHEHHPNLFCLSAYSPVRYPACRLRSACGFHAGALTIAPTIQWPRLINAGLASGLHPTFLTPRYDRNLRLGRQNASSPKLPPSSYNSSLMRRFCTSAAPQTPPLHQEVTLY